jgi:hypothetical protein
MKTLKLVLLLILSAALTLGACKKDKDNEDNGDNNPPPSAKKSYLKKYIEGNGDFSEWTYNANNQLIKLEMFDKGETTADKIAVFEYSGEKLMKLMFSKKRKLSKMNTRILVIMLQLKKYSKLILLI